MNRKLFSILVKQHILTPEGLFTLFWSFFKDGISLMALMRFSAKYYPDRCALVWEGKRFTYKELYDCAQRLARMLFNNHGIKKGMCVGLVCRNHVMVTLLLPALSRIGVRVKLFNTDITQQMVGEMVNSYNISLLICDSELKEERIPDEVQCKIIKGEDLFSELLDKARDTQVSVPRIIRGGDISIFTGGTSGISKETSRKMYISQYLPPFYALLVILHLDRYDGVFLSLPVYHGFGLVTLIISFAMGKKVCLESHFDAKVALKVISEEKIEVVPVVPAMLGRLWQIDEAPTMMKSVKCIISGGDRLDKKWVEITKEYLGNVLYNLFGTTEAGVVMIATPEDLSCNEEVTIGKPIKGLKCKIENPDNFGVGSLWVRSGWAMIGLKDKWQDTGDLVFRNAKGYYFYRGRSDNMVVCGGENVYPENVEKVINSLPDVLSSVVYPVTDSQFGTVLNARVELKPTSSLTPKIIKERLRPRLSRAEMPHDITIESIITSATGKLKRN